MITTTPGPTATVTPVPFVCANAPGSQGMYAFVDHDHQIYRVTGCANPVRLTSYDQNSFARPLAFSPGNRWLMVSVTQTVSDTSYPDCQVGSNPCNWTGPWDVSPDGSHILYYSPGPTIAPSDTCQDEAETPLFYARSDGSDPVRLFADQPLGHSFPAPLFSPDGKRVSWYVSVGPICTGVGRAFIQTVPGGAVTALPNNYGVVSWRPDGAAVVVSAPTGEAALYTLATRALTPLPTQDGWASSYVWGA
jgi:hypothetical protein